MCVCVCVCVCVRARVRVCVRLCAPILTHSVHDEGTHQCQHGNCVTLAATGTCQQDRACPATRKCQADLGHLTDTVVPKRAHLS